MSYYPYYNTYEYSTENHYGGGHRNSSSRGSPKNTPYRPMSQNGPVRPMPMYSHGIHQDLRSYESHIAYDPHNRGNIEDFMKFSTKQSSQINKKIYELSEDPIELEIRNWFRDTENNNLTFVSYYHEKDAILTFTINYLNNKHTIEITIQSGYPKITGGINIIEKINGKITPLPFIKLINDQLKEKNVKITILLNHVNSTFEKYKIKNSGNKPPSPNKKVQMPIKQATAEPVNEVPTQNKQVQMPTKKVTAEPVNEVPIQNKKATFEQEIIQTNSKNDKKSPIQSDDEIFFSPQTITSPPAINNMYIYSNPETQFTIEVNMEGQDEEETFSSPDDRVINVDHLGKKDSLNLEKVDDDLDEEIVKNVPISKESAEYQEDDAFGLIPKASSPKKETFVPNQGSPKKETPVQRPGSPKPSSSKKEPPAPKLKRNLDSLTTIGITMSSLTKEDKNHKSNDTAPKVESPKTDSSKKETPLQRPGSPKPASSKKEPPAPKLKRNLDSLTTIGITMSSLTKEDNDQNHKSNETVQKQASSNFTKEDNDHKSNETVQKQASSNFTKEDNDQINKTNETVQKPSSSNFTKEDNDQNHKSNETVQKPSSSNFTKEDNDQNHKSNETLSREECSTNEEKTISTSKKQSLSDFPSKTESNSYDNLSISFKTRFYRVMKMISRTDNNNLVYDDIRDFFEVCKELDTLLKLMGCPFDINKLVEISEKYYQQLDNYDYKNCEKLPEKFYIMLAGYDLMCAYDRSLRTNYRIEPINDNIFDLSIKFTKESFDSDTKIYQQLEGNYVELRVTFVHKLYPYYPPTVSLVYPRFKKNLHWKISTMKMIQADGWKSRYDLIKVIDTCFEIINEEGDIQEFVIVDSIERKLMDLSKFSGIKPRIELDPSCHFCDQKMVAFSKEPVKNPSNEKKSFWNRGVGYGHFGQENWDISKTIKIREDISKHCMNIVKKVTRLIANKTSKDNKISYHDIIESSVYLPYLKAEFNGKTFADIIKNIDLFDANLDMMRIVDLENIRLFLIKDKEASSLFDDLTLLEDEARTYQKIISRNSNTDQREMNIIDKFRDFYKFLNKHVRIIKKREKEYNKLCIENNKSLKSDSERYNTDLQPELIKEIDFNENSYENFSRYIKNTDNISNPLNTKGMRRVCAEIASMENSLPLSIESSIFFRYSPDNIKCHEILITGPVGTPYESGCFHFRLYCPSNYPEVNPNMITCTTGGGTVKLNPNLYADGKICLSLLGTFDSGNKVESWIPYESTILQVLISIQSMVLTEYPYFNEAGYEKYIGTKDGEKQSIIYNHNVRLECMRLAMIDQIRNPVPAFHDAIIKHFTIKAPYIKQTCSKWVEEAPTTMKQAYRDAYATLCDLLDGLSPDKKNIKGKVPYNSDSEDESFRLTTKKESIKKRTELKKETPKITIKAPYSSKASTSQDSNVPIKKTIPKRSISQKQIDKYNYIDTLIEKVLNISNKKLSENTPKKKGSKKVSSKPSSREQSSDDSSDEEEEAPKEKKVIKKSSKPSSREQSSDDSSSEEETPKEKKGKKVTKKSSKPSSREQSSDDSSEEKPPKEKKVVKKSSKPSSREQSSDDSSSDENLFKGKTVMKKPSSREQNSTDSSSDENLFKGKTVMKKPSSREQSSDDSSPAENLSKGKKGILKPPSREQSSDETSEEEKKKNIASKKKVVFDLPSDSELQTDNPKNKKGSHIDTDDSINVDFSEVVKAPKNSNLVKQVIKKFTGSKRIIKK